MRAIFAALCLTVGALPALADRALLIGLPEGSRLPEAFREAGFQVTNAPYEKAGDMRLDVPVDLERMPGDAD